MKIPSLLFVTILFASLAACGSPESAVEAERAVALGKADVYGSCEGSDCNGPATDGSCWCDEQCSSYGDCCSDKALLCDSDTEPGWSDELEDGEISMVSAVSGLVNFCIGGNCYGPDPVTLDCSLFGDKAERLYVNCNAIDELESQPTTQVLPDGTFTFETSGYRTSLAYEGWIAPGPTLVLTAYESARWHRNNSGAKVTTKSVLVGEGSGALESE